jgi:RimJ/RimL family protein N-acetyltransferase
MSRIENVTLRKVEPADLDLFFTHQLDPEGIRLAAFVRKERKERAVFDAHWKKILSAPQNNTLTILADGKVAGHVACFPSGNHREVTYWIGREFWGQGLATEALTKILQMETTRPILAQVATDNFGSLKVLQKCGFKITGKDKGFAEGRGAEVEEYLLRLD